MSWDHRCNAYCRPEEGLHCRTLRVWTLDPGQTGVLTPADIADALRREHGIILVHWEPASEAPPVRPEEVPIGMRHERDWLIWYREENG